MVMSLHMNYFVNITSQGQISIPAKLRKKYNLEQAGQVLVRDAGTGITLERVPDIDELMGVFKTKKRISFRKIRTAFEDALARGEA